jgi:hypothetical protein
MCFYEVVSRMWKCGSEDAEVEKGIRGSVELAWNWRGVGYIREHLLGRAKSCTLSYTILGSGVFLGNILTTPILLDSMGSALLEGKVP